MALLRASYEGDPLTAAGHKVHHLYDLHQLASQPEMKALLAGPATGGRKVRRCAGGRHRPDTGREDQIFNHLLDLSQGSS